MKQHAHFTPPERQAHPVPKTIPMDIMDERGDRFICSLQFYPSPMAAVFGIKGAELLEFIYEKRPSLRTRKIIIFMDKVMLRPDALKDISLHYNAP